MTKDQFIFEMLEMGCWHEWKAKSLKGYNGIRCVHCEKFLPFNNPDFTTWEGFGKLMEEMERCERFEEFVIWLCDKILRFRVSFVIPYKYLKPIPMRDAVADFLGREEE